jgi:hypothetical protein
MRPDRGCPVENVVMLKTFAGEEIKKNLAKIKVVRFLVESERTNLLHVVNKLLR